MKIDFNIVSLVLAVISICLSVFAIWQANEHKKAAQESELAAVAALTEIKSESRAIRDYAIPELKCYGDAMREFIFQARVRDIKQSEEIAPSVTRERIQIPAAIPDAATQKNLRGEILATVRDLTHRHGKAQAMSVTEALKTHYDFDLIFGELLMLRDEGVIRWQGTQDVPQAYAGIEIVEDH